METYPAIPGWRAAPLGRPCLGFRKYDGSNLRWEWRRKKGWTKFGTRERLFDESEAPYNQAIALFMERLAEMIVQKVTKAHRGIECMTAFTEFFGPNSFAGNHRPEEEKSLVLLDLHVPHVGILPPRDFLKLFDEQEHVAELLYEGNFNRQFIDAVRAGEFAVEEGLVCKGVERGRPWAAKVKTLAYLERLKGTFGERWVEFADGQ